MAVDQWHKNSNEAERVERYIYDDFKLKTPVYLYGLYQMVSALQGLNTATKPCLLRQVLVKMLKWPQSSDHDSWAVLLHIFYAFKNQSNFECKLMSVCDQWWPITGSYLALDRVADTII